MNRPISLSIALFAILIPAAGPALAEEGMYPMSELQGLDLQGAGIEVDSRFIYNPDGLSLVDGICKIGGCTGSFVSQQGLILTNHHCAFRAIRDASTPAVDYLAGGFSAATLADEIPAAGYTVRITDSYRDVSAEVLDALTPDMEPAERTRAVEKRMKEISLREEEAHPGKRAEVSEMFQGKTYVLFLYTYLKDVRLVYAPPRDIGNFGGEQDNWIWPRHSGDFSFLRAYVRPDGSGGGYDPDNVPYRPRRVLDVAGAGVEEGDAVFLFGYPGRTYRHRSAAYLAYLSEIYMPGVTEWYGWLIDRLEGLGAGDRNRQLRLAARVRGLHNTRKNYRGKLRGIDRLGLVDRRRDQEAQLEAFIQADSVRSAAYGDVLAGLDRLHTERSPEQVAYEMWLRWLLRSPELVRAALTIWENALEQEKPEAEREWAYMDRNRDQTRQSLEVLADNLDPVADRIIAAELLRRGERFAPAAEIDVLSGLLGQENQAQAERFLRRAFSASRCGDRRFLLHALGMTATELAVLDDPVLDLVAELYEPYWRLREQEKRRKGELDVLQAGLLEARRELLGRDFIPEANGTLRLTYGRVEGYSPRDAVHLAPLTTLAGILEKETGEIPYRVPQRLKDLWATREFGVFGLQSGSGVPVDLLYSTDTTGGNSGSPVFNARGQVVGLNFDRSWEATINDFAWNHAWSRSIGVDIRYVLWVTWKFGGNERLLQEMGVDPNPTGE